MKNSFLISLGLLASLSAFVAAAEPFTPESTVSAPIRRFEPADGSAQTPSDSTQDLTGKPVLVRGFTSLTNMRCLRPGSCDLSDRGLSPNLELTVIEDKGDTLLAALGCGSLTVIGEIGRSDVVLDDAPSVRIQCPDENEPAHLPQRPARIQQPVASHASRCPLNTGTPIFSHGICTVCGDRGAFSFVINGAYVPVGLGFYDLPNIKRKYDESVGAGLCGH